MKILVFCAFAAVITAMFLKIRNLEVEKTRLTINQLENELDYARQIYENMLKESTGLRIDWEQSGIAKQKRLVESLEFEIENLRKKRKIYF